MALALESQILAIAQESGLKRIGLFFQRLDDLKPFTVCAGETFHAASTMKVAVMMEAFYRNRLGEFDLGREIQIRNEFTSVADGQPYSLDRENDSDPALYDEIGKSKTAEELVERMITRSGNLATNLLMDQLKAERVQALLDSIGCQDLQVKRGVEDNAAYRAGIWNTATARALGKAMMEIANGGLFPAADREAMMAILSRQEHRSGIPAGLIQAVRIGNKTGWLTKIYHDAAIVELGSRGKSVLVVLTEGLHEDAAPPVVASLASLVHEKELGYGLPAVRPSM